MKKIIFAVVVVVVGLLARYGMFIGGRQSVNQAPAPQTTVLPESPSQTVPQEVSFKAPDSYVLSATFWHGAQSEKSPAVILVHQFRSDRHDFDNFIPVLREKGYAVLAYDIRGFGKSRGAPANINDFPLDVRGAVEFLKQQPGIDEKRIGVIGASVGANVAFVASGSIEGIRAAVSLSPSNTGARGVLLGNNVPGFAPKSIFIASDENEKADADFIFSRSGEPKEQKVYPGFGHGIGLLRSNDAIADIIAFLKINLGALEGTGDQGVIHIPIVLSLVKNSGVVSADRGSDNVLDRRKENKLSP